MGTTASSEVVNEEPQVSGVRISGSAIKSHEELLEDAYNRGRVETLATFDELAAQVYDRATAQIVDAQKESVEKSIKLLRELQSNFPSQSKKEAKLCFDPRNTVLRCLQENRPNPLSCHHLVEAYYNCASTEFESN